MNKKIFLFLYNLSKKSPIIKRAAVLGTKASYYIFFIMYGLGGIYLLYYRDIKIARYIIIPLVVIIFNTKLRRILKMPRPFSELNIESLIGHKEAYSMPSNHAVSSAVISFALIYINFTPYFFFILMMLTFLTGLSRVMTGVHYPRDVFMGWFLGIVCGGIGFFVF